MITRIFFATDVHGSDVCWRKFINAGKFYKANVLILGGDMTGKAIVPIIKRGNEFSCTFLGKEMVISSEKEVKELEDMIKNQGYYLYIVTPEEMEELKNNEKKRDEVFMELMIMRVREWLRFADEKLKGTNIKCYVCPGNDDHFAISEIINESECVKNTEGLVVRIDDHHEMISTGWTNPTPWKTYKECSEEELSKKIEELVSQVENISNCIFNFHAPPYGSGLDLAPKIDESLKQDSRILIPVGSQAVRASIEKYQPLLGLHGHIHEGKGFTYIGRTLCVNPGSSYERGVLLGVLINIDSKSIKSYLPVVG